MDGLYENYVLGRTHDIHFDDTPARVYPLTLLDFETNSPRKVVENLDKQICDILGMEPTITANIKDGKVNVLDVHITHETDTINGGTIYGPTERFVIYYISLFVGGIVATYNILVSLRTCKLTIAST